MTITANNRSILTLSQDFFCTGIHGITKQEVEEGTLEAGSLIKDLTIYPEQEGIKCTFQTSTNGGENWYLQKGYGIPRIVEPIVKKVSYSSIGTKVYCIFVKN